MAASGVAEHMEGLRQQNRINRRAFARKVYMDSSVEVANQTEATEKAGTPQSTKGTPRKKVEYVEYSAKIPHRYNSTAYTQQW